MPISRLPLPLYVAFISFSLADNIATPPFSFIFSFRHAAMADATLPRFHSADTPAVAAAAAFAAYFRYTPFSAFR